ncbi:hypothetical protein [Candidatus Endomicrobiellum agilis]|uniref:hypothetical protein n=1 Tax=Candidatus Endomicrobiellum agilis TaxID=3238957 RepID=UPI0035831072|nr:hypothetical protein [Endomicrobium sp.]
MKKIICICICICICSSFGCNRTADNVSHAPQSLNASALAPQSSNAPALAPQSSNAPALAPQSSNAPASELQPMPSPTLTPSLSVMSVLSAGSSLLWSLFCSVCKIVGYIVIFFVGYYSLGYFLYEFVDTHNSEFAPQPAPPIVAPPNPVENEPLPNLAVDEYSYSQETPNFSSLSTDSEEIP